MATLKNPRFLSPADTARPYKSHRYDVFGLKIDRMVTLFGLAPLHAWIRLESDPTVLSYCERPIVVADSKPKRVVSFWVCFRDHEKLWLLPRQEELERQLSLQDAEPAFFAWATQAGMTAEFISPTGPDDMLYLDNWSRIIRELSANQRFVSLSLRNQILDSMITVRSLSELPTLFPEEDPVLLRTAAYSLLHSGMLRCKNIGSATLGSNSLLERV